MVKNRLSQNLHLHALIDKTLTAKVKFRLNNMRNFELDLKTTHFSIWEALKLFEVVNAEQLMRLLMRKHYKVNVMREHYKANAMLF